MEIIARKSSNKFIVGLVYIVLCFIMAGVGIATIFNQAESFKGFCVFPFIFGTALGVVGIFLVVSYSKSNKILITLWDGDSLMVEDRVVYLREIARAYSKPAKNKNITHSYGEVVLELEDCELHIYDVSSCDSVADRISELCNNLKRF